MAKRTVLHLNGPMAGWRANWRPGTLAALHNLARYGRTTRIRERLDGSMTTKSGVPMGIVGVTDGLVYGGLENGTDLG